MNTVSITCDCMVIIIELFYLHVLFITFTPYYWYLASGYHHLTFKNYYNLYNPYDKTKTHIPFRPINITHHKFMSYLLWNLLDLEKIRNKETNMCYKTKKVLTHHKKRTEIAEMCFYE